MSMRISERLAGAGLLCLMLVACDGAATTPAASATGQGAGLADCAIGAGARWNRNCSVEREGDVLTFRHGDGGFRRFRIVRDGHGLVAADGAEKAHITVVGKGQIEVAVAQDRYRLPATIADTIKP